MPPRCFLAVGLAPGTVRLLDAVDRTFLEHAPAWAEEKWVRPRLFHVTVKFIGSLPDGAISQLSEALSEELSSHHPFALGLCGVRAHPSPRRASMLWAVFEPVGEDGASLVHAVDRVLTQRFGVDPDTRPFTPHITLVRARSPRLAPVLALEEAQTALLAGKDADRTVSVRSVTLYSSTLGRSGPEYRDLGSAALGR